MSKLIIRSACLVLALVFAFAAIAIQESQLTMASDQTKYPASVKITTANGNFERITYARTIIEAIDEASIPVGESDCLSLPDNTPLLPGENYDVNLTRLDQVTLNWSGFAINTSGGFASMAELMSRSGFSDIDISDGSRIENSQAADIIPDDVALTYVDVDKKIVRVYEEIPYSSITVDEPTVYIGKSVVKVAGQNGERALVYEETYENGILLSSVQTGVEIVREPVQKVIGKGTKVRIVYTAINRKTVGRQVLNGLDKIIGMMNPDGNRTYGSFTDNGNSTITVDGHVLKYAAMKKRTITMYDGLDCCMQDGCHTPAINHNTLSGIPAQRGLVATYGIRSSTGSIVSSLLPMGTIIFVEGYGLGVVADVHGAKDNPELIDACYYAGEIRAGVANFGKMYSRVYILSMP